MSDRDSFTLTLTRREVSLALSSLARAVQAIPVDGATNADAAAAIELTSLAVKIHNAVVAADESNGADHRDAPREG